MHQKLYSVGLDSGLEMSFIIFVVRMGCYLIYLLPTSMKETSIRQQRNFQRKDQHNVKLFL